jgi:hypothetical protein
MPIDGVIALDPVVVAHLIGREPIRVPSYPRPITGQNAVRVIENQQYFLPRAQQNAFPGELIAAAWGILSDPPNVVRTAQQLGLGLREKRMQIWSADKEEQALVRDLNWDGGVEVGPGDYLYVTDSKLKPNKVDYYTFTEIAYDVKIQEDGSVRSTVKVTLDNRTPSDAPPTVLGGNRGTNRALIGAYVPKSAELIEAEPESGPHRHEEGDALVFLRIVDARAGDSAVVRLTYSIPEVVETTPSGSIYRLRIQHQPMVNLTHLTVRVTVPAGEVVKPTPGWKVDGATAIYEVDLDRDIDLRVGF